MNKNSKPQSQVRLTLNRQALRPLTPEQLFQVAGAAPPPTTFSKEAGTTCK
jgi:hypothetical protein